MDQERVLTFIKNVLDNMPADWLRLTTHRLDIYNEEQAKTQFLEQFEALFAEDNAEADALAALPTAYDYIRLGHPLSCVLEWTVAKLNNVEAAQVISFSSVTIPLMAVLRENALASKNTRIAHIGPLPGSFDAEVLKEMYGFSFELQQIASPADLDAFEGSTVLVAQPDNIGVCSGSAPCDFMVNVDANLGSIILVNGAHNTGYISKIQHVRRRETIAMTPADCVSALRQLIGEASESPSTQTVAGHKQQVRSSIQEITGASTTPLVASSGLSMQFAIAMGLIHDALETHPGKDIKFVVPPNCYGGTNDQARRVAATLRNVEVMDLPVDAGHDMVASVNSVLDEIARMDAVPYIIAEIPTNPRVEVPDLEKLEAALSKERTTPSGAKAIEPVFILDQTFCPNTPFLGEDDVLASVQAISYVSGSKFPSGGRCTAGYCVANQHAAHFMDKIALHLQLCDNEATGLQYATLASQLPTMNDRIQRAYENTRAFVNFIKEVLPDAKINFVSEELAQRGFTPSVFSLDLPTKGETHEEREAYKRKLNLHLIDMMISEIPNESKYCVSYGQLKGCYWTIPATSTQGTTKEGDKDYIARVALSPDMDLERHKAVFQRFVDGL